MTRWKIVALALSLSTLGGVAGAEPDRCRDCPWAVGYGEAGNGSDCASLHALNRQAIETWAAGYCNAPICSGSFYTELSCTVKFGVYRVRGRLDYQCDCTVQASVGPEGAFHGEPNAPRCPALPAATGASAVPVLSTAPR